MVLVSQPESGRIRFKKLGFLLFLLRGPEGPEPALGSLGAASCFVVSREIHFNADIALASRPSCPPGRRAVSTLTDDLARYASRVLEGRALLAVVCYGALPVARAVRLRSPPQGSRRARSMGYISIRKHRKCSRAICTVASATCNSHVLLHGQC